MRTVSTAMQAHLENEVQTLALCWKIQRRDGAVYGYTDHDEPIVYDGTTYTPIEAGTPSDYRQNSALTADNIDFDMVFGSTSGRDAELRAGVWDFAQIWTFKINWEDTSTATGIVKLAYGRLGEIQIQDNFAKIELRTLTQQLSNTIGSIYTPECRTSLGTTLCKIGTTSTVYTRTGTISAVTDQKTFTVTGDAAGQIDGFFDYGSLTFASGGNSGIEIQITDYTTTNVITLYEEAPYTLSTGVTFSAVAGCDRRWVTCKDRFSNKDNFRGFPHIPGMDAALVVPSNTQWQTFSTVKPSTA
jgi:uncharacterized phage protein (TIGR02218 family)